MLNYFTDTLEYATTQLCVPCNTLIAPSTEICTSESQQPSTTPDFFSPDPFDFDIEKWALKPSNQWLLHGSDSEMRSRYEARLRPYMQTLIDGTTLNDENTWLTEYHRAKPLTADEIEKIGFKIKKGEERKPVDYEYIDYYNAHYKCEAVKKVPRYRLEQCEPLTGIELKKYIITQYLAYESEFNVGVEKEHGIIYRKKGNLTLAHFSAHVSNKANTRQRHYAPGQREINMITLDVDCHSVHFIPIFDNASRVLYEELMHKNHKLAPEDYTVAYESRNERRGVYLRLCFHNPVNAASTYNNIRILLNSILSEEERRIVEIFPDPKHANHLIRCPLAPTHSLVLNGQISTDQKEKTHIFADMCMNNLTPAAPLPWKIIQEHNEKNHEKNAHRYDVDAVESASTRKICSESEPNQIKNPHIKQSTRKKVQTRFRHVFHANEDDPNFKAYMTDPATVCTKSQADVILTSFAGYVLLMIQMKTGNNATYEMLLEATREHNALFTTPLPDKIVQKITKSIFAKNNYYSNYAHSKGKITVGSAGKIRSAGKPRKIRTEEDELARQTILIAFRNSAYKDIEKSNNPFHYTRLVDVRDETYKFMVNSGMLDFIENKNKKALSHIIADPFRWSFFQYIGDKALKTVGTRRKIKHIVNGKTKYIDEIVYMGYKQKGHTYSAYNKKTHCAHVTYTMYFMEDGELYCKQFNLIIKAPTEEEAIKKYYKLVAEIEEKQKILLSAKNRRAGQVDLYARHNTVKYVSSAETSSLLANMTPSDVAKLVAELSPLNTTHSTQQKTTELTNSQLTNSHGLGLSKSNSSSAELNDHELDEVMKNEGLNGFNGLSKSNSSSAELNDHGLSNSGIDEVMRDKSINGFDGFDGLSFHPPTRSSVYVFCYTIPAQIQNKASSNCSCKWKHDAERRINAIFMRRHGYKIPEYYKSRTKE